MQAQEASSSLLTDDWPVADAATAAGEEQEESAGAAAELGEEASACKVRQVWPMARKKQTKNTYTCTGPWAHRPPPPGRVSISGPGARRHRFFIHKREPKPTGEREGDPNPPQTEEGRP